MHFSKKRKGPRGLDFPVSSRRKRKSNIVRSYSEAQLAPLPRNLPDVRGRKKELWNKAEAERQRCQQWLVTYIRPGQPKHATKAALCELAMRELKISKNSFDAAWIAAIEDTGRHDWYEPFRRKSTGRH